MSDKFLTMSSDKISRRTVMLLAILALAVQAAGIWPYRLPSAMLSRSREARASAGTPGRIRSGAPALPFGRFCSAA